MCIVGRHFVSSQFNFSQFTNLPTPPPGFSQNFPSAESLSSSLNEQVEKFNQNFASSANQSPQRVFESIFNAAQPSFIPTNPIAAVVQNFANLFNISSLQNVLSPSGARQLGADVDYDSVPASIRQILRNAIERFDSALNATLVNGLARLENSFQSLNQTALSTIAFVANLTTSTIQDIGANITQYNQTVQSCINTSASDYREILPAARDEAINCIHQKTNEGRVIIEEGRSDITDAIYGAQNLTETIRECSSETNRERYIFGAFGCYLSAVVNIHSETIALPFQMTRRFSEMADSVTSIGPDAIKCAAIVTQAITEQSLNVTQTIANCLIERR